MSLSAVPISRGEDTTHGRIDTSRLQGLFPLLRQKLTAGNAPSAVNQDDKPQEGEYAA
jgi:hypothetical protein